MDLVAQIVTYNWYRCLVYSAFFLLLSEALLEYRYLFVSVNDDAFARYILEVIILLSGTTFLGTLFYLDVAIAAIIFDWTMSSDVLIVVLLFVTAAYALFWMLSEMYATAREIRKLQLRSRRRGKVIE